MFVVPLENTTWQNQENFFYFHPSFLVNYPKKLNHQNHQLAIQSLIFTCKIYIEIGKKRRRGLRKGEREEKEGGKGEKKKRVRTVHN